jgi:hypothetical protein
MYNIETRIPVICMSPCASSNTGLQPVNVNGYYFCDNSNCLAFLAPIGETGSVYPLLTIEIIGLQKPYTWREVGASLELDDVY